MRTPDQYLEYAEECLRSAQNAKTEGVRKAFLDMARTWTEAAAKIEGTIAHVTDAPPPKTH